MSELKSGIIAIYRRDENAEPIAVQVKKVYESVSDVKTCIGGNILRVNNSELHPVKVERVPIGEKEGIDSSISHPEYYNRYSVEVVEMARRIWGDEAMKTAAEITAFIYRMRAGVKPDNPVEKDLSKEQWWLDYRKSL